MQELLVAMKETKFFGQSYLSKHDVFNETFSRAFYLDYSYIGRKAK